jgi:hypothetical protein
LPHDEAGEVEAAAYNALLRAISTQREEDFERIPVTERKLVNPRSGWRSMSRVRTRSRC